MRNNLLIFQFCIYDEFKQFGLMTDKINFASFSRLWTIAILAKLKAKACFENRHLTFYIIYDERYVLGTKMTQNAKIKIENKNKCFRNSNSYSSKSILSKSFCAILSKEIGLRLFEEVQVKREYHHNELFKRFKIEYSHQLK